MIGGRRRGKRFIIHPVLRYFRDRTGRDLRLRREKEIVAMDSVSGGMQESVILDFVSRREKYFVLVIESKRVALGDARK